MPNPVLLTRKSVLFASVISLVTLSSGVVMSGCVGRNAGGGKVTGVLRYALTAEPTTLDPALVTDGPTIDLLHNIYEGLVGWNDSNEVVPLGAEKWDVSADGKTYTFTLRSGVKFQNGKPVVAGDYAYAITRSLDPKLASPVALNYLDDIVGAKDFAAGKATTLAGVKVIDDTHIAITITAPRSYFLGKLTFPTAYALDKTEVEKGEKVEGGAYTVTSANVVGTGPFKLGSYVRQGKVVLDANADYWAGAPKLKKIERPIILDAKTARNRYDAGQLDIVTLEKGDYERDKADAKVAGEIQTFGRAATFYLGLNQTHYAPFKDKRVRQAVAHAIDKDAIIKTVLLGINKRAEGVLPEGLPGYDASFKGLPYDTAKASELLAAAGYPGGKGLPPLVLSFREKQTDLAKAAEVMKEQLGKVGIPVTLREMEWGTFLKATDNKEIDLFHMRWQADYIDPQNFLSLLLTSSSPENRTGYANKEYDAMCAAADSERDAAKRMALYAKAERFVVDDAPWVPLYFQKDLELVKPWVKGIKDSLMGHLPHKTTSVE